MSLITLIRGLFLLCTRAGAGEVSYLWIVHIGEAKTVVCSNTRTSLSTLNLSTLSVLTDYAEFQMSVSFQIEYSAVR